MNETTKILLRLGFVFGVTLVLAAGVITGSAAAEEGELAELNGNGTEQRPYVITDAHELQAMNEDLEAHYVLENDIDASETATWEAGAGFTPIGDGDDPFMGSFDGRGHTISGVQIDRPGTTRVGLFGYTFESTIENVQIEDVSITGGEDTGSVVGFNDGEIRDVSVSGQVQGTSESLGGVVGTNAGGITESEFEGEVEGTSNTVGGLVGSNLGPIDSSYVVGAVEGDENVGGLVGNNNGPIRASFAAGDVLGESTIGGLIGLNSDAINDVYSTANVSGEESVGGLISVNGGTVTSAYTTGTTDGTELDAGLMATNSGITNDVYWNVETTGHSEAYFNDNSDESDVVGLDSDDLTGEDPTETTELDFDSEWETSDQYPRLAWESDRDVPEEAYDVITEPVELEENTETEESESDGTTDTDQERDADEVLGVPGFGVMPAALALLAIVALIGYRKRS